MKIPSADLKKTPFEAVKFTFVKVTPELAADWLHHNRKNRRLKDAMVEGYTIDMRNGAWMTTHQGIAFDADENLIDGQHRLQAIVRAKSPVLMLVTSGWPAATDKRKTMDAVDRGAARTLADQLHVQHDVDKRDAGRVVQICNALAAISFGLSRVRKSSTDTILAVFALYKKELEWVLANPIKEHGIKQSTVIACIAMGRAVWADKTSDFLNRLMTGENLAAGNPILPLRNWLMGPGSREDNALVRQVTFHHMAAFVDGQNTPQVIVNSDKAYIRIMKLHKVRVEKICAIYAQPLPDFLRSADDKPVAVKKFGPLSTEAAKIGETLSETFSSTDLMARIDGNAGQWLAIWKNQGWIDVVAMNLYRRTAKFGVI